MTRALLPAALALALALGGWGWWQHLRAAGLEEAARALDRHLQRVAAERDRWAAIAAEVDQMEGADDPLNAYERAVLDRVRNP